MANENEGQNFQQALTKMNRDFLVFICKELEVQPGADLTPSIKSYMQNLAKLDDKYSECKENQRPPPQKPQSRVVIPINRNLHQLRKKMQLNPASEILLQSPQTPSNK